MLRYGMDSWYAFKDSENTYSVLGYLILENDVEKLEELLKCGSDCEELNAWKSNEESYSPLGFSQKFAMNVENKIHFGELAVDSFNVGVRPAIYLLKN